MHMPKEMRSTVWRQYETSKIMLQCDGLAQGDAELTKCGQAARADK